MSRTITLGFLACFLMISHAAQPDIQVDRLHLAERSPRDTSQPSSPEDFKTAETAPPALRVERSSLGQRILDIRAKINNLCPQALQSGKTPGSISDLSATVDFESYLQKQSEHLDRWVHDCLCRIEDTLWQDYHCHKFGEGPEDEVSEQDFAAGLRTIWLQLYYVVLYRSFDYASRWSMEKLYYAAATKDVSGIERHIFGERVSSSSSSSSDIGIKESWERIPKAGQADYEELERHLTLWEQPREHHTISMLNLNKGIDLGKRIVLSKMKPFINKAGYDIGAKLGSGTHKTALQAFKRDDRNPETRCQYVLRFGPGTTILREVQAAAQFRKEVGNELADTIVARTLCYGVVDEAGLDSYGQPIEWAWEIQEKCTSFVSDCSPNEAKERAKLYDELNKRLDRTGWYHNDIDRQGMRQCGNPARSKDAVYFDFDVGAPKTGTCQNPEGCPIAQGIVTQEEHLKAHKPDKDGKSKCPEGRWEATTPSGEVRASCCMRSKSECERQRCINCKKCHYSLQCRREVPVLLDVSCA